MQQITIREMTNEHLPQALQLYNQSDMDNGSAVSLDHAKTVLKKIQTYPFYRFYLASNEQHSGNNYVENILGVFGLLIMDNLGHGGAPSGIIEGVCVHSDYQNKGIGTLMMQHAMATCRENNCYKMMLSSNKNRIPAHQFYRQLGFEQHGLSFHIELS